MEMEMLMETCNITYKSSQTMKDLCTCKIKTCDELEDDKLIEDDKRLVAGENKRREGN